MTAKILGAQLSLCLAELDKLRSLLKECTSDSGERVQIESLSASEVLKLSTDLVLKGHVNT